MQSQTDFNALPDDAFVRVGDVKKLTALATSTIWRMASEGRFPKPIKVTPAITAWRMGHIRAWLREVAA